MPLSGSKLLAQHFAIYKTQGKKYEGSLYVHSNPRRTKFPHTILQRRRKEIKVSAVAN